MIKCTKLDSNLFRFDIFYYTKSRGSVFLPDTVYMDMIWSIVQIIHRDCGLKCLSFTNTHAVIVSFSYIYISQGSVATPLRCGEIFNKLLYC